MTEVVATDRSTTPIFATVKLDQPFARGDEKIATIRVRKPFSGELRGLSIASIANMDVDELRKLLPRITTPMLHAHDIDGLDPADLLQLGGEVVNFLLPTAKKPAYPDQ